MNGGNHYHLAGAPAPHPRRFRRTVRLKREMAEPTYGLAAENPKGGKVS